MTSVHIYLACKSYEQDLTGTDGIVGTTVHIYIYIYPVYPVSKILQEDGIVFI